MVGDSILSMHSHNGESYVVASDEERQEQPVRLFFFRPVTVFERFTRVSEPAIPLLPNEVIGLIVDGLCDDIPALRACSTTSSLLYSFCKRPLYRNINLNTPDKVDQFVLASEDSDLPVLRYTHTLSLGITGTASWRYADKLAIALGVFSKKASIQCLTLKEMKFTLISPSNLTGLVETAEVLSRTVSKVNLLDCLFV